MVAMTGGAKLEARLRDIARKINEANTVSVGFLEGSTYPDGTSLPMVAAIQEFGGTIKMPAHDQVVNRKVKPDGEFANGGRFVRADKANFQTVHPVAEYTITIPARPYFRTMIAASSPGWGKTMGAIVKASDYDAAKALAAMGEVIQGQLQASIKAVTSPPLAASTVAAKGFSKPLVDTGHMLNSVSYEVTL